MDKIEEELKKLAGTNVYVDSTELFLKFHQYTTLKYRGDGWWGDSECMFHKNAVKQIKSNTVFLKSFGEL